jgi:hypothetical protein
MNTRTMLAPRPPLAAVAREEGLATALLQRRTILVVMGVTLWLLAMAVWSIFSVVRDGQAGSMPAEAIPLAMMLVVPLAILGALWPTSVWQNLGPSEREYLWALPVERPQQTLLRTVIGWVTLMLVITGIIAALLIALSIARTQFPGLAFSPAGWYLCFTGATLAYLLATPLGVLTDHPARWMIGGFIGLLIVRATFQSPTLQSAGQLVDRVVGSLLLAITGLPAADSFGGGWTANFAAWMAIGVVLVGAALLYHQER